MALLIAIFAIGAGLLRGLPVWFYWIVQKLFRRSPSRINLPVMVLVGLFSFVTVLYSYTEQFIKFEYEMTMVSAPSSINEEKIKYQDDAIHEAIGRSLIPPAFQKNCSNKPEPVCRLGRTYALGLWDSKLDFDFEDMPLFGALIASFTSVLFVLCGNRIFQNW